MRISSQEGLVHELDRKIRKRRRLEPLPCRWSSTAKNGIQAHKFWDIENVVDVVENVVELLEPV